MRNLELTLSSLVLLSIGALAQSQPTATLTSSNPIFGAVLGSQVAISGSTVVSPADYQQGAPQDVAIFVFTKPATAPWTDMTESARLIPPIGGVAGISGAAISGDANVIVGLGTLQDFVYVFTKPTGGWKGVITPIAVMGLSSPAKPWVILGSISSIAINAKGDTIVVGAYNAGTQGHNSGGKAVPGLPDRGAAYVFVEPPGGWAEANWMGQTATLTASDGVAYDQFGWAVGISANTVVVGAPAFLTGSSTGHGSAYVFTRPATGVWLDTAHFKSKFTATDEKYLDGFGAALAVGNSGALVALGSGVGHAYVFARTSAAWPTSMTQTAELTPSDMSGGDFGTGLALGNNLVVVGAPLDGSGASYTFTKPANGWADMSLPASMVGGSDSGLFGISSSVGGKTTAVGAPDTTVNGNNGAGAVYLFSQ